MKVKDHGEMVRLLTAALQQGAIQVSATRVNWQTAGNCYKPFLTVMEGRPPPDLKNNMIRVARGTKTPLRLYLQTRCRKCEACLRYRTQMWSARALQETRKSVRTWFITLTLKPEIQYHYLCMARHKLAIQSLDYDALEKLDQFNVRHCLISQEITRYLKRLRKNSGASLKYLIVAEAHKSGNPHYHMLIHETDESKPIRKALIQSAWTHGFSNVKLLNDPRAATYLCKYLSKSLLARVRASQAYGRT